MDSEKDIKLAVFDVDGTLLASGNDKLSTSTKEALQQLKKNGVALAIASGRPPFLMKEDIFDGIAFDYYICVNGAYVADHNLHQIYSNGLPLDITEKLIQDFEQFDDALLFQFEDAAYIYHGSKRIQSMIHQWIGRLDILRDERLRQKRHLQDLPLGAVAHIAKKHLSSFVEKYPDLIFEPFAEAYYDIHEKSQSKAVGVSILCKEMNISMKNVIAFGDNYNDLEMIQAVGYGVAMGNAVEKLKAVSDYVSESVDQDGIYLACKHYKII